MSKTQQATTMHTEEAQFSQQVAGKPFSIGEGFTALNFKHDQFDGLMDPLAMVDHYTMTSPTFGAHPHAGMSAVSILFEDSEGIFNNRDSLGNNIDLQPGDVYWLKAGRGAVHDEKPTPKSRTHGLQIFVNLPQRFKHDAPASLHVPSKTIPVLFGAGYRVRVLLGESNGLQGATSPALPFTALDGFLESGSTFTHDIKSENSLLVYAVNGGLNINIDGHEIHIAEKQAVAVSAKSIAKEIQLSSNNKAHFVILQGKPIREQFIQKGPFVMSNIDEINQVTAAYEAGLFGSIAKQRLTN